MRNKRSGGGADLQSVQHGRVDLQIAARIQIIAKTQSGIHQRGNVSGLYRLFRHDGSDRKYVPHHYTQCHGIIVHNDRLNQLFFRFIEKGDQNIPLGGGLFDFKTMRGGFCARGCVVSALNSLFTRAKWATPSLS